MDGEVKQDANQDIVGQDEATPEPENEPGDQNVVAEEDVSAENNEESDSLKSVEEAPATENPGVIAHPAEFGEIQGGEVDLAGNQNVEMLLDVELTVTVELGRKKMLIADILKLGKGSVVELPKAAGEALDVYINGTQLAKGEVVVIEDSFAIRITELANTRERINSLAV